MNCPDKSITTYIKKHHLFALATSYENLPYAASCFYVYDETLNALIFASDKKTKHISDALKQDVVAGTIAKETMLIKRIQGIQFKGILKPTEDKKLRSKYIKRFPVALFIDFDLWLIELFYIKMTDNILNFAHKIVWEKGNID